MLFINFLAENLGTILVFFAIAAIVSLLVLKLIKDKRSGCSCGCSSCVYSKEGCKGKN